ncbi:PREDICTED: uncharacterized protein LOC104598052 isoform X2 [Nelumbo nucifera]|uniref:Uncharacterized protein LOC104598052 isoform X2 n=1 Tax=Nelumbo nucifera TaxID=4432 RepID=A0A1U7ZWW6_NELNU|nr:PREDICTED: uncharacterized protein LOC104598052 isoform X2 [Nelumbo nucifera]
MIHIQTTEGVQSKIPIPLSRTLILEPEDGWAAFQMQELEPQLIKEKSQETVISKLPLDPYTPSSSGHKPAKKDTSGVFPWEETFENLSPAGSELLLAVLPFYNHCQYTATTKGADKNGPITIFSSIGIISLFGWAYILALTFSIQIQATYMM